MGADIRGFNDPGKVHIHKLLTLKSFLTGGPRYTLSRLVGVLHAHANVKVIMVGYSAYMGTPH